MNGYAFEFEVSRNGEECWEYSSFITNTVDRFERVFETVDGPSTSGNLGVSEFVAGSSSKWSQPVVVPFLQLCNRKDRSEVKRFMRHVWTRGTKHFPNLRRITEIHKSSLDGDIQPNSWNSSKNFTRFIGLRWTDLGNARNNRTEYLNLQFIITDFSLFVRELTRWKNFRLENCSFYITINRRIFIIRGS